MFDQSGLNESASQCQYEVKVVLFFAADLDQFSTAATDKTQAKK